MPAALRRTLIVLVALAAALALGALPALARPASAATDEAAFVSRINGERAGAGLRAYSTAADLAAVARRHAQRMADRGEYYHNPDLANEVGGWSMLGENVGAGYDVDGLHRAFMESAPHRSNILSHDFTQVGAGVARSADGRLFVVEVFRKPSQPVAAAAPAAPAPARPPAPAPAPAPAPKPAPAPPAPAPAPPAAPITTVRATHAPAAPAPARVTMLVASIAPASAPVPAMVTVAAPLVAHPSVAGPAVVAALLIAALLPGLVTARRRLRPAF